MPSARKQRSKEKRSRQSDVMLGTYSRNGVDSQLSENEENLDRRSNERQTNTNPSGDDYRTLLNTNSVGNNDMTSDNVRLINSEITSQVSSKINEFKVDSNLHIRETVEQVISDQVLRTIRETLGEIGNGARPNVDLTSSERHRSPEMQCSKRAWKNIPKSNKTISDQNRHNIENSFEPHSSDEDYDRNKYYNLKKTFSTNEKQPNINLEMMF